MSTYKSDAKALWSRYWNTSPPTCPETSERINTAIQRIIALGSALDKYSSTSADNDIFFGRRDRLMMAFHDVQTSTKSLFHKDDSARHAMVDEIISLGEEYCATSLEKLGFGTPQ